MPDREWKCTACGERNPPYTEACRSCYQSAALVAAVESKPHKVLLTPMRAAAGLALFGAYLLFCAYVGWTRAHWPWLITPLQLDILGALAQIIGEPVGAYIASGTLGFIGACFIALAVLVAWWRPRA